MAAMPTSGPKTSIGNGKTIVELSLPLTSIKVWR